jgi:hypothetical protein
VSPVWMGIKIRSVHTQYVSTVNFLSHSFRP